MTPDREYSADEIAANTTAFRGLVLIPKLLKSIVSRISRTTREGDGKMNCHYTIMNCVRADGAKCVPAHGVEGAPPEFIIIQDPDYVDPAEGLSPAERNQALLYGRPAVIVSIHPRLLPGSFEEYKPGMLPEELNPKGIELRGSVTRSMTKELIYVWGCHFVKHLPQGQGKDGDGVILNLISTSRG
jgi:hypothetical protein